jgi:hypothetical protein
MDLGNRKRNILLGMYAATMAQQQSGETIIQQANSSPISIYENPERPRKKANKKPKTKKMIIGRKASKASRKAKKLHRK